MDVFDAAAKTPLFYAILYGHKDIVQLLLEKSAEITISFLQTAVISNHVDIVQVFLKHRNDLIVLDEKLKFTSMFLAVSKGYLDIFEVLLQYGAKIEYSPKEMMFY